MRPLSIRADGRLLSSCPACLAVLGGCTWYDAVRIPEGPSDGPLMETGRPACWKWALLQSTPKSTLQLLYYNFHTTGTVIVLQSAPLVIVIGIMMRLYSTRAMRPCLRAGDVSRLRLHSPPRVSSSSCACSYPVVTSKRFLSRCSAGVQDAMAETLAAGLADSTPVRPSKQLIMPKPISVSAGADELDIAAFENGALLIDKPLQWTSFDVCGKLRNSLRFLPGKLKVGRQLVGWQLMAPGRPVGRRLIGWRLEAW